MTWIDTHCHLCNPRLRHHAASALERSRAAGVELVICAVGDLDESAAAAELCGGRGDLRCLAGVHPHEAKSVSADYLARLAHLAGEAVNVAIGEIGLDYHYSFSPPDDQRRVLAEQLDLAVRLGKPVVLHTREALDDTLAILAESGVDGSRLVFHSCTESAEGIRRILDLGAMVSFSGIVTFANSADLRAAAALVSDDRILVETDAPFLSPEPVRKMKINEPANVVYVAAGLAAARGQAPQHVAELTTANAKRFFGLSEA